MPTTVTISSYNYNSVCQCHSVTLGIVGSTLSRPTILVKDSTIPHVG